MIKDKKGLFSKISQVGLVVRDMDGFVKNMETVLGAKPDKIAILPNESMKDCRRYYYGEDADFKAVLGFFHFGELQIEAIQPLEGKSIWQDFIDQKGEGLHHIRFSIDDFDAADKHFADLGIKNAQEGYSVKNVDGLKWAYYDTEKLLGFFVEVFNEFEVKE